MVLIDHERQLLQRVKVTILYKVYITAVFFYFVARYICSVSIILKCIMQTLWVIFVVYGNVTNVCFINRQYCSMCVEKITFCLIAAAVSYHSYLFTLKLIWHRVTFKHKYFLGFGVLYFITRQTGTCRINH